jgi:hypothetical protein
LFRSFVCLNSAVPAFADIPVSCCSLLLLSVPNVSGIPSCFCSLQVLAVPGVTGIPELEFLKRLWGLGTGEEEGYRTGPPGYIGWRNSFLGIDSGAPYTFKNTSSVCRLLLILSLLFLASLLSVVLCRCLPSLLVC